MPVEIDFDGSQQSSNNNQATSTNNNNEEVTHLNGNDGTHPEDITGKGNDPKNDNNGQNNGNSSAENNNGQSNDNSNDDDSSTGGLQPGAVIEFDGVEYTVAPNGDIVDSDNKIFKAAAEVPGWLNEVQIEDNKSNDGKEPTFDIDTLQNALGIEITDENGNPVEFENNVEGMASYVNSVMRMKQQEIQEATINSLFNHYPELRGAIDYMQINHGSLQGYNQKIDRSQVQVDKDDATQQEWIIMQAAKEFGNSSINANYIKYLKDSGGLYDEAVNQLKNLVAKDKQEAAVLHQQAMAAQQQAQQEATIFWNKVNDTIKERNIGGYKIPESFVINKNGQKVTRTPDDFFNYLYRRNIQTEDGQVITAYERDNFIMSDEEKFNKDLIDAWLLFTGGTYKDLVDMAIKEDNVQKLRLKSKEVRTTKTIKIVPKNQKADINDILL